MFNSLSNHQGAFSSGCTISHSQISYFSTFSIFIVIRAGMKLYLLMPLSVFLMTNYVEHLFMYLLATCVFSFKE